MAEEYPVRISVHCLLSQIIVSDMTQNLTLPADAVAKRIVDHFQAAGFPGITEALMVRIRLKKGTHREVDAAFDAAVDKDATPPVGEFFEIRPYGFYSQIRDFAAAKSVFQADFGVALRRELPGIYFDNAPVIADDALATGTKYDAMLKISHNDAGNCFAFLLNDPNSSFFEYLGAQRGNDWQKIMGEFSSAAISFDLDTDLL